MFARILAKMFGKMSDRFQPQKKASMFNLQYIGKI